MPAEMSRFPSLDQRDPARESRADAGGPFADSELPASPAETEQSECPPPLMWQDVLAEVRRESECWELQRGGGVLRGWTLGQGPPLYFLQSAWGSRELFALSMWLLREEFRVVIYDGPDGQRRSRLSAEALAEDLLAVVERHGDERFSLFATSFGGLTALTAMHRFGRRIERAVLHAAFAHYQLSVGERLLLWLGRFSRRPFRKAPFFARLHRHNHRRWFPPFDASRWNFLLENLGATPIAEASRRIAALRRCDLRPVLAEVGQPVALLGGEGEGRIAREREAELAAGLPRALCERLPHCGHFPFLTHPHILTKAIRRHLEG